jgi:hypothetical protein
LRSASTTTDWCHCCWRRASACSRSCAPPSPPADADAWTPTILGLALLAALFFWNKLQGHSVSALPSQGGLVFLGVSYWC